MRLPFFEGLDIGANTFFQVPDMGARTSFEVEKVGQELLLAIEIGGLVVFFDCKIPQNPTWIPGKFWTVPWRVTKHFNKLLVQNVSKTRKVSRKILIPKLWGFTGATGYNVTPSGHTPL